MNRLPAEEVGQILDAMPAFERRALILHIMDRVALGDHIERIAEGVSVEWSEYGVTPAFVRSIVEDPT